MITIHNFRHGARGIRVAWLCEEMGLRYRPVVLPFPTPSHYRARHPLGSVPFLEDEDGVAMAESVAMMLYLAERYGPTPLVPQGTALARVLELALMSEAALGAPMNTLLAAKFGAPESDKRNWSVRSNQDQVRSVLDYVAARLGDQAHLTGEEFTIADIAIESTLTIWQSALGGGAPANVLAWLTRLRDRPAYARAQKAFSGGA